MNADVALLKWGQPRWREKLLAERGVDYTQGARRGLHHRDDHLSESRERAEGQGAVHQLVDVREAGAAPVHGRHRARLRLRGQHAGLAAPASSSAMRPPKPCGTPRRPWRRQRRRAACWPCSTTRPISTATPTSRRCPGGVWRGARCPAAVELRPGGHPAGDGVVPVGRARTHDRPDGRGDSENSKPTCRSSSRAGERSSCCRNRQGRAARHPTDRLETG